MKSLRLDDCCVQHTWFYYCSTGTCLRVLKSIEDLTACVDPRHGRLGTGTGKTTGQWPLFVLCPYGYYCTCPCGLQPCLPSFLIGLKADVLAKHGKKMPFVFVLWLPILDDVSELSGSFRYDHDDVWTLNSSSKSRLSGTKCSILIWFVTLV